MGPTLAELKQAMADYSRCFDAALVAPGLLPQALSDAGAIERMAATISSMVAARMADGTGASGGGSPSGRATAERQAAAALARASGTSMGEARRAIDAGKAMGCQPEVAAAARAGELSRQQASLVSGAAGANPAAPGRSRRLGPTPELGPRSAQFAPMDRPVRDLATSRPGATRRRGQDHGRGPTLC
jgi:hypothetical protein